VIDLVAVEGSGLCAAAVFNVSGDTRGGDELAGAEGAGDGGAAVGSGVHMLFPINERGGERRDELPFGGYLHYRTYDGSPDSSAPNVHERPYVFRLRFGRRRF
jgi:hypothetical protein